MPQSSAALKEHAPFVSLEVIEGRNRPSTTSNHAINADGVGTFELSDVSISYGSETVLAGVDLTVPAGLTTALIGPSGCGKSTLLRCLNRMNDELTDVHVGGRITLDGHDINAVGTDLTALRMQVGQIFQRHNPFPFSIYDNIAFGPRLQGLRKGSTLDGLVERSLRMAALWDEVKDKLSDSAFALSGGQQQRLCIARTLAMRPKVLLMDEPCSALDPLSTAQVEETIRGLEGSVTIVIVTHQMQQAARIAHQTAFVLRDDTDEPGCLVEVGPTEQLFSNPRDKRTQDYLTGCFG